MRGNTKADCATFERWMTRELDTAFGSSTDCGFGRRWQFDRPDGAVEVSIPSDSIRPGREYRSRTVFCRHIATRDDDRTYGYSGKNNLHILSTDGHARAINSALAHIRGMTVLGTPARDAMDAAQMWPAEAA